jgi:hypothetical protein
MTWMLAERSAKGEIAFRVRERRLRA